MQELIHVGMAHVVYWCSYCQTNEYYAVADLTKTQQLLLGDFIDFGLLYRKRSTSDRFYTTSLAVNLIFGGSSGQRRSYASVTQSLSQLHAVSLCVSRLVSSVLPVV